MVNTCAIRRSTQQSKEMVLGAHRFQVALGVLLACLLLTGPARVHADGNRDHDQARQALESGQILPLRAILDRIEPAYPGQILEVELERKHGAFHYEIKVLQTDGLIIKIKVDAKDGNVLATKKESKN